MIEELGIFFLFLILSLLAKNFLLRKDLGAFNYILMILAFVGVAIHEISHYVMNLAVGIVPEKIEINWRSKQTRQINPHGLVRSKPRSFLQAVVICLAPLYISTWLFFLSLQFAANTNVGPVIRIIAILFCVSLILGAAPSSVDFNNIPKGFLIDPLNSLYKVFLIILSGVILWIIILYTQIVFILDVFYYFAIIGLYLLLRFSVLGISRGISELQSRNFRKPSKVRIRRFTRTHYKPKKPQKEW